MFPEDGFKDRLDQELAGQQPPPLGAIGADALTAGRRIHRRERTFGVVGSVAAVALVAVGATALAGGFGSATATPGGVVPRTPPSLQTGGLVPPGATTAPPTTASGGHTVPGGGVNPSPSMKYTGPPIDPVPSTWQPPATPVKPSNPVPTDAQAADALLASLLPGGGTASGYRGQSNGTGTRAGFNWTTAAGTATVSITVRPPGSNSPLFKQNCASDPAHCSVRTFDDGTVIMLSHVPQTYSGGSHRTNDSVAIMRPDGSAISVHAFDGLNDGTGPRLAKAPLTDDQLYAIASDPRWGMAMDRSFVRQADKDITLSGGLI